ncbi:uncharacterized protein LOC120819842 isoform X2 [Gasterosteus aculeatus]
MAPRDPLVGTLRVCVLNLRSDGMIVSDTHPHLASCCELLELVLRKGLQQPVLSLAHRDYWHCFEQLTRQDAGGRLSALSLVVEQTRVCRKLLLAQGRGRYLLRLALRRKALPQLITHLLHTPRVLEVTHRHYFVMQNVETGRQNPIRLKYLCFSPLPVVQRGNVNPQEQGICRAVHVAAAGPLSNGVQTGHGELQFSGRELAATGNYNVCETYEVVPCRDVGLVLRYLSGRVFVLDLTPGSQAHADGFVRPGDIIDEINGTSLRNSKNKQAGMVLSWLKGRPLSISILRWRAQDGTMYRPLVKHLRALRMENPALQLGPAPSPQSATEGQRTSEPQCLREGRIVYRVQFLGKANIGLCGGKEVLQHAIMRVLQKNLPIKDVLLDMKETHLTCTDQNSKSELLQHNYPDISCVGRLDQSDYTIFAFCMADSLQTAPATGFGCVALRASTTKECEEIVSRIATGFKHTEWFV